MNLEKVRLSMESISAHRYIKTEKKKQVNYRTTKDRSASGYVFYPSFWTLRSQCL